MYHLQSLPLWSFSRDFVTVISLCACDHRNHSTNGKFAFYIDVRVRGFMCVYLTQSGYGPDFQVLSR